MAALIALGPPSSSRDCFSPTPSEPEAASRHFGIGEKQSRLDTHELRPRSTVFRNRPPFSQGAVARVRALEIVCLPPLLHLPPPLPHPKGCGGGGFCCVRVAVSSGTCKPTNYHRPFTLPGRTEGRAGGRPHTKTTPTQLKPPPPHPFGWGRGGGRSSEGGLSPL